MEAMIGTARQDLTGVLASAAAGDEIAFARIVEAHDDEMYRVCVAVGRDETIAADAVQAAWAIAWRKLKTIREPDRLRPWLVAIAVNETKTLLKRRQKRSRVEIHTDASSRPGGIDPATRTGMIDLIAALERVEPDDRALLAMRYMAGFNASELATALGSSPSAVRQRLKRLMDRLREDLQ
jgi:RNA polymerase sigma factor (sigma-70 family)